MTSQVHGICRPKMAKTESIKFIPSESLNVYTKKEKKITMKLPEWQALLIHTLKNNK